MLQTYEKNLKPNIQKRTENIKIRIFLRFYPRPAYCSFRSCLNLIAEIYYNRFFDGFVLEMREHTGWYEGDFRTASSTDGKDYGCTKEWSDCCAARPATALNSDESESYHCWSSNGRWLVFSSRRDDGLFTRPYVAYIDTNGVARKPFMLPQRNPKEYCGDLMYSCNIPELMTGPVTVPARTMAKVLRESPGTDVGL